MEVFPKAAAKKKAAKGLLHVRGGVSQSGRQEKGRKRSSPRPWRCFFDRAGDWFRRKVFFTSVEVFPATLTRRRTVRPSSPRPWRCFHGCDVRWLGRFGLLHVRGGVSKFGVFYEWSRESSPRPWRCFCASVTPSISLIVFSTSVEVFEYFGSWRGCCLLT